MPTRQHYWQYLESGSGTAKPIPPPIVTVPSGGQEEPVYDGLPIYPTTGSSPSEMEFYYEVPLGISQVDTYRRNPQWFRVFHALKTQEADGGHETAAAPNELIECLIAEPIEDGVTHPSESILRNALNRDTEAVRGWIVDKWRSEPNAGLLAALMKCVGRLAWKEVFGWGLKVAKASLSHSDIEVRDAAVQAIDLWGSSEAIALLREHREDVSWLRGYISQILSEAD